jgi:hypothetical protein
MTSSRDQRPWLRAALLAAFLLSAPANGETCAGGGGPGATLLFPYFESDLVDPAGPTTLLSIGNAVPRPVLGHVVLWTNWGLPVLDFDLFLPARAVQSLDVGALVRDGRLPVSGADAEVPFAGCASPVALPDLDAGALALLRQRLSGLPGDDGLCWASPPAAGSVVSGFVTVDAVGACSATSATPLDDGYFGDGGPAIADDVLWGELYLVDSGQDAAQGLAAVALAAEEEIGAGGRTFYHRGDGRQPLPVLSRHRFLNGGGFDGGTEVLVWLDDFGGERPQPGPCANGGDRSLPLFTEERRESGELGLMAYGRTPLVTGRYRVVPDSDSFLTTATEFSAAGSFGSFKVCASEPPPGAKGGEATLRGLWAAPLHAALGRYSVGVDAMRRCDDGVPESPIDGPLPEWLRRWIATLECAPVDTSSAEVRSYRYQGEIVYHHALPCCDQFVEVYGEGGVYVCAPEGGITGQGDGLCPDFYDVATDEELVWRDPRICELPEEIFGPRCEE